MKPDRFTKFFETAAMALSILAVSNPALAQQPQTSETGASAQPNLPKIRMFDCASIMLTPTNIRACLDRTNIEAAANAINQRVTGREFIAQFNSPLGVAYPCKPWVGRPDILDTVAQTRNLQLGGPVSFGARPDKRSVSETLPNQGLYSGSLEGSEDVFQRPSRYPTPTTGQKVGFNIVVTP